MYFNIYIHNFRKSRIFREVLNTREEKKKIKKLKLDLKDASKQDY